MTETLKKMTRAAYIEGHKWDGLEQATTLWDCLSQEAHEWLFADMRTALQALCPPSPAVELAVALASCSDGRSRCQKYGCAMFVRNASGPDEMCLHSGVADYCLTRARRTVEALVTAVLGEKGNG